MKKIFTFAAAVLASLTMFAQTITLSEVTPESNWYGVENLGRVTNKSGNAWSSPDLSCDGSTGYKTGSSYFTVQTYQEITGLTVWARSGSNRTIGKVYVSEDLKSGAQSASNVEFEISGGDGTNAIAKNACDNEFTITFSDAVAENNYIQIVLSGNADIVAVTFVGGAPSTDPVQTAEISGENACLVGGSIELTCNAPNATVYQWSMNGAEIADATAKKYTFAPTAAGEYSFTCAASNDYTATPVVAAAHVVTVVDPAEVCGELIKATHTGGKTATVTGLIGGTVDKNTASDGKFGGKGQYFGITLASGAFQAGDELNVHTTTAAGQGTLAIYADKAGATLLYDTESMGAEGDNVIILPTALNNATTLYICRTEANTWNGYVDYIAVTRSCEASSNANIESLSINGEVVEAVEGVYSYTVGASVDLAAVEIVYTLAHPKATATPASGFTVNVPAAGAAANTQTIVVTAQDNTQATYTVSVAKSAAANNDATLSALAVEGYTLAPAFDANVLAYTITKAYGAENPAVTAVSATKNDANAQDPVVAIEDDVFPITVTAEDGPTQLVYTITIEMAAARKALLEASFSNGVHGFILNGNIDVPYLASEAEPTFVDVKFWQADGEPTAEIVEGNLVVTGIDGQADTYTITYVPLTPMAENYEEITFNGSEIGQYIYSVYGWDEGKGMKFSKDVEEATNHRISEGKDRFYMALPAAQNIVLTSGSGANRPVDVLINGHYVDMSVKTPATGATINFPLNPAGPNFIGFESHGNNGDAGFTKIKLEQPFPTAIENSEVEVKAVKVVRNGQLFIEKNGVLYNAQGTIVK